METGKDVQRKCGKLQSGKCGDRRRKEKASLTRERQSSINECRGAINRAVPHSFRRRGGVEWDTHPLHTASTQRMLQPAVGAQVGTAAQGALKVSYR